MKKFQSFLVFLFCAMIISFAFLLVSRIYESSKRVIIIPSSQASEAIPEEKVIVYKNTVWIDSDVPRLVSQAIKDYVSSHNKFRIVENKIDAEIIVDNTKENSDIVYRKYYVPVTSFSSLGDGISLNDLKEEGSATRFYYLKEDEILLKNQLIPSSSSPVNNIDELISIIKVGDIALISLDKLEPRLKVLKVEGENILDKNFSDVIIKYFPYIETSIYTYNPKNNTHKDILSELTKKIPSSNRDISKMTTLAMTGVTAISRGVEFTIKSTNDPAYPSRGTSDILSRMDITHVNSENSFFDGCPQAEVDSLILCGKTASIASLKAIGTDIVDLNGNHQTDFGKDKFLESIGHLNDTGFQYFGGGRNEEDAGKILYIEKNDTKLAFLSYAYFDSMNGKEYRNIANGESAGVNFYSEEKVRGDIVEARKNADFVIVDYQFTESYSYKPLPEQRTVFRRTIDTGADLVVGVQAHQPQEIEFYNNKMIFYGLGNFFFNQMWSRPTRQGLIPIFTFYNGKLISTELLTTLLYEYSQPRFTKGAEREALLSEILP